MNVVKLLKNYFETSGKDCLDADDIKAIWGILERSDENGWRAVDSIFIHEGSDDLVAFTVDEDGGEDDEILYLTVQEDEALINWLTKVA